eukprot:15453462-Alexandrium_andersonii.AAC.1
MEAVLRSELRSSWLKTDAYHVPARCVRPLSRAGVQSSINKSLKARTQPATRPDHRVVPAVSGPHEALSSVAKRGGL